MTESENRYSRWAIYAPRPHGPGWLLHGIYPSQGSADAHAQRLHPRVIVPISLRGRPPQRFADLAALERYFEVADG